MKFLQDVLDALFAIFSTEDGNSTPHSGLVFHALGKHTPFYLILAFDTINTSVGDPVPDPHPDPLVRGADTASAPDPSLLQYHKFVERNEIMPAK